MRILFQFLFSSVASIFCLSANNNIIVIAPLVMKIT